MVNVDFLLFVIRLRFPLGIPQVMCHDNICHLSHHDFLQCKLADSLYTFHYVLPACPSSYNILSLTSFPCLLRKERRLGSSGS